MTRLTTLLAAALLAIGSAGAFAQGKADDPAKATPATPASPAQSQDAKKKQKKKKQAAKSGDATKTQKRAGEPQGEAKGQAK